MNVKLQSLYILYSRNDNKGSIFITFNKFRKTFINNTEKRTPALQKPIFSTIFYISIHKITHAKKERRHKPAFPFWSIWSIYGEKSICVNFIFLSISYLVYIILRQCDSFMIMCWKLIHKKISAKKRLPYDRRFLLV